MVTVGQDFQCLGVCALVNLLEWKTRLSNLADLAEGQEFKCSSCGLEFESL